jgi:ATP-dependent DNA helicase RecQ
LSDQPKHAVREWIEQLVDQEYLVKTGEYHVLKVTDKGWRVIRGEETPRLLKPVERKKKKKRPKKARIEKESWEGVDEVLFEELRDLRRAIASQRRVPAYIVFGDASLRDMARKKPVTIDAFMEITGVGKRKSSLYSRIFLSVIKDYVRKTSGG